MRFHVIFNSSFGSQKPIIRAVSDRKSLFVNMTYILNSYFNDAIISHLNYFFLSLPADNAIPIQSWFSDPYDTALLCLLPVLDALRFVSDVRSILSRNLHRDAQPPGLMAPRGVGGLSSNATSPVAAAASSTTRQNHLMMWRDPTKIKVKEEQPLLKQTAFWLLSPSARFTLLHNSSHASYLPGFTFWTHLSDFMSRLSLSGLCLFSAPLLFFLLAPWMMSLWISLLLLYSIHTIIPTNHPSFLPLYSDKYKKTFFLQLVIVCFL